MPPSRRFQKSLTTLYRKIRRQFANVCIRCPECEQVLTLNTFYNSHSLDHHCLNVGRCCVFCLGNYSWGKGERQNRANVEHVEQCLQDFIEENRVRKKICNEENNVPNRTDDGQISICKCFEFVSQPHRMCRRAKKSIEGLYKTAFGQPEAWSNEHGIHFDKLSGLDKDVYAIIQRYLKQDLEWIHVMLKADMFEKFVKLMTPIRDKFIELPFWCLCDGMKDGRVTHRHMILAYDKTSDFMTIWQRDLKYPSSEDTKNGKKSRNAKKFVTIKNAFHLIRTIVYVSTPKATCDRGIPKNLAKAMKDGEFMESHFCINRPMSEHAIAYLATLIPNGIEQLLREQNMNKRVIDWEEFTVKEWKRGYGKWCVPISKTQWKFEKCVIPVDPSFEPTDEKTDLVLHMHGNKKLYFKKNPALLDMPRDEWVKYQASKGNTFQSINDEYYELAQNQQKTMRQLKEMKVERDAYWMPKMEDVRKEKQALMAKDEMIEKELGVLRTKFAMIERELEAVKVKMEMIEKDLDTATRERDTWCAECAGISKEKDVITNERDTLRTEKIILTRERDTLRTEYAIMIRERDTIARERDNLQLENAMLKDRISSIS